MKKIFFCLIGLLLIFPVSAYDFAFSTTGQPSVKPYMGETVDLGGDVTPSVTGGCKLICKWSTPDLGEHEINNGEGIPTGFRKDFGYQVIASGSEGQKSFTLTVKCKRSPEGALCFESDYISKQDNFDFEFYYNGDGECQTENEDCTNAKSDCFCSSSKSCIDDMGDASRSDLDSKKCETYCGNGIVENNYETCSNCPGDIGKCDGSICVSGNECEGEYCVHEICWNKPWKEEDNFCDINEGENCKNSNDCSCKKDELCSNAGVCEKIKSEEKQISEAVKTGVQETLETSENRQKTISYTTIGLIIVVILGYILFKIIKEKKSKVNPPEKKINEVHKKIKKIKKEIKRVSKKKK